KWAECGCSPGSVARLSTMRPLGPYKSVKSVARLFTGDERLYGSCALTVEAMAITHTKIATNRLIMPPPMWNLPDLDNDPADVRRAGLNGRDACLRRRWLRRDRRRLVAWWNRRERRGLR